MVVVVVVVVVVVAVDAGAGVGFVGVAIFNRSDSGGERRIPPVVTEAGRLLQLQHKTRCTYEHDTSREAVFFFRV